jgi:hypothetical protein
MSSALNIYGTTVQLPTLPSGEVVENWGTDNPKEQYWRRKELPQMFEDIKFDTDGAAILNAEQKRYANEEVRRCKRGFYFMNNGNVTYITGKNYLTFTQITEMQTEDTFYSLIIGNIYYGALV